MKTLKVKSILFSLLAIMAVAVFMTSCEQDIPTESDLFEVEHPNLPQDFDYNKNAKEIEDALLSLNSLAGSGVTEDQVFSRLASNFTDNDDENEAYIKEIKEEHLLLETMDPLDFVDRNFSKAVDLRQISLFQKEILVGYYAELFQSIESEEISDWEQMLSFWNSKMIQATNDSGINDIEKQFIKYHISLQIGYSSFWNKMQILENQNTQNNNAVSERACDTPFKNTACDLIRDAARATARAQFNCGSGSIFKQAACFLAREAVALIAGATARSGCCAAFPSNNPSTGGGNSGCSGDQAALDSGESNCNTAMGTWSSSSSCNGNIIFSVTTTCYGSGYCCRQ